MARAGANLFDVFWVASSGQARNKFGFNYSLSELETAHAAGIRVFRAFASDWGPNKLFWKQHTDQFVFHVYFIMNLQLYACPLLLFLPIFCVVIRYWQEFDSLVDRIDTAGLYWIPSIGTDGWDRVANALTPGLNETVNDFVKNASSVSRQLALEYFGQFSRRYFSRPSLLFWELGNELNLMSNLPPPWYAHWIGIVEPRETPKDYDSLYMSSNESNPGVAVGRARRKFIVALIRNTSI